MCGSGLKDESFVPLVEHRERAQVWRWIGGGRDADRHLVPLNAHLLELQAANDALKTGEGAGRVPTSWP